jgi:hypothetical protein
VTWSCGSAGDQFAPCLVDARMHKDQVTPNLHNLAAITVGLGPNCRNNCDIAVAQSGRRKVASDASHIRVVEGRSLSSVSTLSGLSTRIKAVAVAPMAQAIFYETSDRTNSACQEAPLTAPGRKFDVRNRSMKAWTPARCRRRDC